MSTEKILSFQANMRYKRTHDSGTSSAPHSWPYRISLLPAVWGRSRKAHRQSNGAETAGLSELFVYFLPGPEGRRWNDIYGEGRDRFAQARRRAGDGEMGFSGRLCR